MSQNLENGYKLFGFIDAKFRESISSFLLGGVLVSIGWFVFYTTTRSTLDDLIKDKADVIKEERAKVIALETKLNKFDEECQNRLLFFSELVDDMRDNIGKAKDKSISLADTEAKSLKRYNTLENKVKSKIN